MLIQSHLLYFVILIVRVTQCTRVVWILDAYDHGPSTDLGLVVLDLFQQNVLLERLRWFLLWLLLWFLYDWRASLGFEITQVVDGHPSLVGHMVLFWDFWSATFEHHVAVEFPAMSTESCGRFAFQLNSTVLAVSFDLFQGQNITFLIFTFNSGIGRFS